MVRHPTLKLPTLQQILPHKLQHNTTNIPNNRLLTPHGQTIWNINLNSILQPKIFDTINPIPLLNISIYNLLNDA